MTYIVDISGGLVQSVLRDDSGNLPPGVITVDYDTDGDESAALIMGDRAYVSYHGHGDGTATAEYVTALAKFLEIGGK